ncbi:hypothetical protein DRO35_01090 [Candidatus Bathyarchaeota archaeon]|nr:MAG: hypothetical protein DRO35_01090 [Candidatus Bathyarchaeota archaeon]
MKSLVMSIFNCSKLIYRLRSPARKPHMRKEDAIRLMLFMIGFLFFLWIFARSSLIPGVDGPYYLIQVRSLLVKGRLVYGDPPLAFYLLALFTLLIGDVTLGIKVGVSLFCALSTLPMYLLVRRITGKTYTGYLAMLLVIFSAFYIRMMTDFIKNAIGIFFLLFFIYYIHNMAFTGHGSRDTLLALMFLLLTGLTHILDFSVALFSLGLYLVMVILFNVNRKSFLKNSCFIALILTIFVTAALTRLPFFFMDFNKILSFIWAILVTPKRELALPPFLPRPRAPPMPIKWTVLLTILVLGIILSAYEWRRRKKEQFIFLSVSSIMGITFSLPFIPTQWLWRLLLMEFIPSAYILSYGLSLMKKRTHAVFAAVICLVFFGVEAVEMALNVRPTINPVGYLDLKEMKTKIPKNSVVIPFSDLRIVYWIQYIDEVDVAGPTLSPYLWKSHPHVLGLFRKGRLPFTIDDFKVIYVGRIYILVEIPQKA